MAQIAGRHGIQGQQCMGTGIKFPHPKKSRFTLKQNVKRSKASDCKFAPVPIFFNERLSNISFSLVGEVRDRTSFL